MNKAFGNDDERLAQYVAAVYAPEDALLRDIRTRAEAAGMPDIQVAALDGRHLEVLVRMTGARRAVEIGTLAGYSGVSIARGLGEGGRLFTFELEPMHVAVATESFQRAGVANRVRIIQGAARDLLATIEGEGPFDFCFIDADKEGYPFYLEWAERNLRPGGVVAADNAFLFGGLPSGTRPDASPGARAMDAFHRRLANGGAFRATVFPTGEGLAVGVRV